VEGVRFLCSPAERSYQELSYCAPYIILCINENLQLMKVHGVQQLVVGQILPRRVRVAVRRAVLHRRTAGAGSTSRSGGSYALVERAETSVPRGTISSIWSRSLR